MDVLADQISFDVDFITNPAGAQISVPQCEWNNRHRKPPSAAFIDSQTDSIDGDRAFRYQQRSKLGRHPKTKERKFTFFFYGGDGTETVDVSRNQMAAESILKAHGPFEIDQASGFELFQIRALESFWRNIRRKLSLGFFCDRQTGSVHRDAGADLYRPHGKFCLYHQPRRSFIESERRDIPDVFDQSGKHGLIIKLLIVSRELRGTL
jgi:hypothetical protein